MRRYVSGPVTVRRKGINRLCRDLQLVCNFRPRSERGESRNYR